MTRYFRKNPVTIEAWQFLANEQGDETKEYPQWLMTAINDGTIAFDDLDGTIIHESHGTLTFKDTDWIIFGSPTDIYPCKDETFVKIYSEVDGPDAE